LEAPDEKSAIEQAAESGVAGRARREVQEPAGESGVPKKTSAGAFAASKRTKSEEQMSVSKSLVLAAALVLGMLKLGHAASRYRAAPVYDAYSAYGGHNTNTSRVPAAAAAYGGDGYSTDPHTRALEILADKYKPGW
jgi:hypothetical protein